MKFDPKDPKLGVGLFCVAYGFIVALLSDILKKNLLDNTITVIIMLVIGSIIYIILEIKQKEDEEE
ncbi:MAG: hypothetical protein IKX23_06970 [Treponema sp.]|nr:hypothetical protein [Treponema sp.]